MNLRPDLSKPLLVAWAAFGGVLLLCGGGDRDIAYLTFYKFKASRK